MPKGSPRPRAGRGKKIPIDLKRIERLGSIGSTVSDAARELGIPMTTLATRLETDPEIKAAWDRGAARTRNALREKQIVKALNGDNVMLIWMGKQWLGQSDSPINVVPEEEPTISISDSSGRTIIITTNAT